MPAHRFSRRAALLIAAAVALSGSTAFALWARYGAGPRAPTIAVALTRGWYDAVRLNPVPYAAALAREGANVVLLNPGDTLDDADGLLFIGGEEATPADLDWAREAERRGLPVLGICRGCQVIALAHGATLRVLGPDQARLHGVTPRSLEAHPVHILPGTRLHGLMGEGPHLVSSTHLRAVDDPGPRLRVAARAPDGVIEAVELPGDRWVVGIQWHPELESLAESIQRTPFRAFVEAARR